MGDTKKTKSASTEGPANSEFKFCWGNFEKMFQMMQKFCGGEKGTFDCGTMMQKMCGVTPEKPDQG